jgi:hypothetical protein
MASALQRYYYVKKMKNAVIIISQFILLKMKMLQQIEVRIPAICSRHLSSAVFVAMLYDFM